MIELALTPRELIECHKIPEILRCLADYHDCKQVEAAAIGDFELSVKFHADRAGILRAEADQLENEL